MLHRTCGLSCITSLAPFRLRLQEHQMKREAEQHAWGVCLRVHFDLWRKRMDERKERALDGRAREVGNNWSERLASKFLCVYFKLCYSLMKLANICEPI